MRKFVVLMLVLGMASLANAVYDLALDGDDAATLTGDGVNTAYFISTYDGTADITILFSEPGSDFTDYFGTSAYVDAAAGQLGVDPSRMTGVWLAAFVDTTAPPDNTLPDGIVATFLGNLMPVTVSLHNSSDISVIEGVTLTPEPMSLMLLGLGGLFLRRRK